MKARWTLLLTSALTLSSFAAAPSTLARPHGCLVPGEQRTVEVKLKVLDKVVARGDIVRIEVRTYRPAQEDFLGSGASMPAGTPMQPVGDTPVTLGVLTANEIIAQNVAIRTDSEGRRLVKMKLGSYHKKGPAVVRARAKIDHFSEQPVGTCVELQEGGYAELRNALTVR